MEPKMEFGGAGGEGKGSRFLVVGKWEIRGNIWV